MQKDNEKHQQIQPHSALLSYKQCFRLLSHRLAMLVSARKEVNNKERNVVTKSLPDGFNSCKGLKVAMNYFKPV